jgi:hypothetical protein
MKIQIPEFLKRPFWIALWAILLVVFVLKNDWGINFDFHFQIKSQPRQDIPAEKALETQTLENLTVRYRDCST